MAGWRHCAHYDQVSAYHHNNYRPLMWRFFRPYRAALFRLSRLLVFRCATHDQSLIAALQYIQRYQHTTRALLPVEIALDFASVRWQALIKTRHKLTLMLHRRHLEVCVFPYLDQGLRSGDVYVEGSEAYADYRQQLLPWAACLPRLPAYCQAVQLPATAAAFVAQLQAHLRDITQQVDRTYPMQTTLTIDAEGGPILNASRDNLCRPHSPLLKRSSKLACPSATSSTFCGMSIIGPAIHDTLGHRPAPTRN